MSLQTKFAVLLALIGVAVVVSVSTALWSFNMVEREVSRPFRAVSDVMGSLGRIKADVEVINTAIAGRARLAHNLRAVEEAPAPATPARPTDRDRVGTACKRLLQELKTLEENEWYVARVGRTASRSLRERLLGAPPPAVGVASTAARWIEDGTPENAEVAIGATIDAHNLIELVERHVVEGAAAAVLHDQSIREQLLIVLGMAILWAVLVLVQGFLLLRRWVLRPVSGLRAAAARIGSGDFDHRIAVAGRDELAQLSGEFNHMATLVRTMQDERVERERLAAVGEMVRRLAHNLRNPLAGIRGLAEVTRDDLPRESDLRLAQDRIITAVDRFEHWLGDLLSATSPLTIRPEVAPVAPMLEGLVASHRPVAETRGVELVLRTEEAPARARFDPRHLEQALVALVANAIDASPRGGRVLVSAGPGRAGTWEVRVADQGPGVPPELAERIFKPYFTTKPQGNGIGLAVALQVVKAHGGVIAVENSDLPSPPPANAGPGALFRVVLPGVVLGESVEEARVGLAGASGGQNSRH